MDATAPTGRRRQLIAALTVAGILLTIALVVLGDRNEPPVQGPWPVEVWVVEPSGLSVAAIESGLPWGYGPDVRTSPDGDTPERGDEWLAATGDLDADGANELLLGGQEGGSLMARLLRKVGAGEAVDGRLYVRTEETDRRGGAAWRCYVRQDVRRR